jgi:hypothetical protein
MTRTQLSLFVIGSFLLLLSAQSKSEAFALPQPGIYLVEGQDHVWGKYAGKVELRKSEDGKFKLSHIQQWEDAQFENEQVALAWEGQLEIQGGQLLAKTRLDQVGFITQYGDAKRTSAPPLNFVAQLYSSGTGRYSGVFVPEGADNSLEFYETWTWQSESDLGAEPIWRNRRQLIAGHKKPSALTKAIVFNVFKSFHKLDSVQPYVDRPEFQDAVHYWVFDPTDYGFYRKNPNVLRVIQKVVDPISLVETRIRNRAYRQTLQQKEQVFDGELESQQFVNDVGMLTSSAGRSQNDGMLWTGMYVASQALRYLAGGEQKAFDNMLKSLKGLILCYDITGEQGNFARTIAKKDSGETFDPKNWVPAKAPYQDYYWKLGGNNDMVKGFFVGFTFAYLALKKQGEEGQLIEKMAEVIEGLVNHNKTVMGSTRLINRQVAMLMLQMLSGDPGERHKYHSKYKSLYYLTSSYVVGLGNGSSYVLGMSDWSGNNLNMLCLLTLYTMASEVEDSSAGRYAVGMARALGKFRNARLGLFQQVYSTIVDGRPTEDSLWVLREFPAPKMSYSYDWRINPSFVISPIPDVPWKFDWKKEDREKTLTIYPLFEKNPDTYQWKDPLAISGRASKEQEHGADFLFAYWFGRYYGGITEGM